MASTTPDNFDCYECEEDECDVSDTELFVCDNAISCWKSTVRQDDGTERYARGCIDNWQHVRFVCSGSKFHHIECCHENLCNGGSFPTLQPPKIPPGKQSINVPMLTVAILTPLFIVIIFILCIVLYYRRNNKGCASLKKCCKEQLQAEQHQLEEVGAEANNETAPLPSTSNGVAAAILSGTSSVFKVTPTGDHTIKEYFGGQSLTSGSGSGLPLLMQRTFSKQISLVERLNQGHFGFQRELWRGIWQGENVAVKIYSSLSELLWARETEVYTRLLPSKHDNILGYLGSDTTSAASCTQLWLVTHFHPNGSLRNYLKEKRLGCNEMFKVCLSLSYGLLYLHTEIHGTQGKKSMAHRNLNSKTVFVKNDGTCAIADFGYAVTQERIENDKFLEYAPKRYMSPELLERTFDPQSLESFRQADMYSLGLVFWEICRRSFSNEEVVLDYAVPYSEWLLNGDKEPTLEEMKQVVVVDQRRPEIPVHWQLDEALSAMGILIKECWQTKAAARLPILRVKKTLIKLASTHPDVDVALD